MYNYLIQYGYDGKKTLSTSAISTVTGMRLRLVFRRQALIICFRVSPGLTPQGKTGEPGYDAATLNIRIEPITVRISLFSWILMVSRLICLFPIFISR